ncbi:NAD-binding Rossmann fold oxidoreductase [Flammula alnicola]|nr:NAD-binding Rossmann fold oxidoreductase [Flammula alnicola]
MSSPIKVGFIGLSAKGWAASALGPSLIQPSVQEKFKLIAISTTSEASANVSAEKYGALVGHEIKAYHGDSSQIAGDPDLDLVFVSVKAPLHKQVVLPVIEAKKNFFVEWPAGANSKETLEIAEAAKKNGVKSIVGLQGRNSPTVKKVKELINSGAIGPVRSSTFIGLVQREHKWWPPIVSAESRYAIDKKNGVTSLSIIGGHQLDSFTFVLGDFSTVNATAATIYPTATIVDADGKPTGETLPATNPDHYSISGELKSGALATIVWRTGYPTTKGRRTLLWEIDGEEGSIRLESDSSAFLNIQNATVFLNGEKVEVAGTETELLGILGATWESYAKGEEGQYATIDDAVKNRRVLDAVERSLAEGKTIVL